MMHIISLGAGVQSTTMALMAAHGEIMPMPDAAIFADTGWEPKAVYDHLAWLRSGNVLPFPVHVVSSGNLRDDALAGQSRRSGTFAAVPWFIINQDGSHGMGRRQCTSHYKVDPIRRKVRELLGKGARDRVPAGAAELWLGISLDEVIRATPSKVRFVINRFPLLEQRKSRRECVAWLACHGYQEPPKSACIGCPFHNNATWRDLKRRRPDEWAEAVAVDRAIRKGGKGNFMHAQRIPLDEVDLTTAEDRGQLNLFVNECEGMCGV
jgi:hypothetical protein